MMGPLFWKKNCLEVGSEGSLRKFLLERKEKVTTCTRAVNGKGTGTNSGKSGTRNLEAARVGSCAERKFTKIDPG